MWGTERDQEIMEICTIYETNIFRNKGYPWLILIRSISFFVMCWLLYADYQIKHKIHYEKYTVWGAWSTLVVLFLMILCSIEKYHRHAKYDENNTNSGVRSPWLWKTSAFMF
jgi:hypothetical protein